MLQRALMTAACKAEESKGRLSWCCAKNTGFAQPAAPVLLTSLVFFDWLQAFVWNLSPSKSDWLIIWWLILSRTKSIKIAQLGVFHGNPPFSDPPIPLGNPNDRGSGSAATFPPEVTSALVKADFKPKISTSMAGHGAAMGPLGYPGGEAQ